MREEAALAETIDAEVSDFDEVLIKWGFKEDPRIPEECRVDQMTRIKDSGQLCGNQPVCRVHPRIILHEVISRR